jgi:HK97 family phage portal protein|tara:strand:+ start:220 stop:1812 length:1593 start_codon:yes stop_codon:yes gene_type:complete
MGLLTWFRGKEDKEERSNMRDPAWWKTVFTGSESYSGENVTQDSALRQAVVWACVQAISQDVASLPIKIYSKIDEMVREPLDDHPVGRLFHTAPNKEMSPFTFKETMTSHVLLYGNAFAEIERNQQGQPIGLWILLPENMSVRVIDGEVVYNYSSGAGSFTLPSDKVFHLKGFGHDGILGYSPINYARQVIGDMQAMQKSGGSFFANSSRPSGILSHPAKLSEDASRRLRKSWDGLYSSSNNSGRTAILEEGLSFSALSIPHSESQWLEARQFAVIDICRMYRMPPHIVQDLTHATYSNIESQQIQYLSQTLMTWLRRWEQEINRKLIGVDDRSVYAEFLAEEALRGNTLDRYTAYRTARESGWLSINEIRKRENLNNIGELGDRYIQPLNFSDVGFEEVVEEEQRQSPAMNQEQSNDWWVDSVRRAVAIVRNASNRKAEKVSDEEWNDWLIQSDKNLSQKVAQILEPCCRSIGADENKVTDELLKTWIGAVGKTETREHRIETCNNWAKSFVNYESAELLIQRIKQDDQ